MVEFDEDVIVRDATPNERIRLESNNGNIIVRDSDNNEVFRFDSGTSVLHLGAAGNEGDLRLYDNGGAEVFFVNAAGSSLSLGQSGGGSNGNLVIRDNQGRERFVISFDDFTYFIRLRDSQNRVAFNCTDNGSIRLGSTGNDGSLSITSNEGQRAFQLLARSTSSFYGNQAALIIQNNQGIEVLRFRARSGSLFLGNAGRAGDLVVTDNEGNTTIHLDGQTGQIHSTGADLAEEFLVSNEVAPGMVLVINNSGGLSPCAKAYDKKVAGIVSGANNYSPGLILDKKKRGRQDGASGRMVPLSLSGKTFAKVDASNCGNGNINNNSNDTNNNGSIEIGDLLTTSTTRGHAMKVSDYSRAPGSVIGKALGSLKSGTGIIPILVSLQ